jgi:hypothetical protein
LLLKLLRGISLHFYLISCLAQRASIILDEEKKKKSLRCEKNITGKLCSFTFTATKKTNDVYVKQIKVIPNKKYLLIKD